MKKAILILVLVLTGCSESRERVQYRLIIPDSNREVAARFIQETVRASNPNVDDPEEAISEATRAASELYGSPAIGVTVDWTYRGETFIPYEQCNKRQRALCDDFLTHGN